MRSWCVLGMQVVNCHPFDHRRPTIGMCTCCRSLLPHTTRVSSAYPHALSINSRQAGHVLESNTRHRQHPGGLGCCPCPCTAPITGALCCPPKSVFYICTSTCCCDCTFTCMYVPVPVTIYVPVFVSAPGPGARSPSPASASGSAAGGGALLMPAWARHLDNAISSSSRGDAKSDASKVGGWYRCCKAEFRPLPGTGQRHHTGAKRSWQHQASCLPPPLFPAVL
jgi:hypothetical protein